MMAGPRHQNLTIYDPGRFKDPWPVMAGPRHQNLTIYDPGRFKDPWPVMAGPRHQNLTIYDPGRFHHIGSWFIILQVPLAHAFKSML